MRLHLLELATEVLLAIPPLDITVDRGDVVVTSNLWSQAAGSNFRLVEPHDFVPPAFIGQQHRPRDHVVVRGGSRRLGRTRLGGLHRSSRRSRGNPSQGRRDVRRRERETAGEAKCDGGEQTQTPPSRWYERRYSRRARHRGDPFARVPQIPGGIGAVAPLTACDYGSRLNAGQKRRPGRRCFFAVIFSGHPV